MAFISIGVLLLCLGVFKAVNSKGDKEEGYLYPYPEECTVLLNLFAEDAANLTSCSIKNARPIHLCENCIEKYTKFKKDYELLLEKDVNGTSCREVLLSQDRLNAIVEYHDKIKAIWNKGNCNACFDWPDNNPVLANNTLKFNLMFNDTMNCIINNIKNNSTEVCEKCMQSYIKLDEFYKSLSADQVGLESVCMDIVDSMNATRSIWSKKLNCCRLRKTPEVIFLCCTGIISLLPVLYYLSVRFCGPIRDLPNVLRQSRFKQRFLRSSRIPNSS